LPLPIESEGRRGSRGINRVIALLALAYASGVPMREAARLANLAAGRVVLKFGTSEVTPRELLEALAETPQ